MKLDLALYAGSPNWTIIMIVSENLDAGAPVASSYHTIAGFLEPLHQNFHSLLLASCIHEV